MTFKTQVLADIESIYFNTSEFAETVTYTPKGGSAKSIICIWLKEDAEMLYEDGKSRIRTVECRIKRDATTGIASPANGDTITKASEDWPVIDILSKSDYSSRLMLRRIEVIEKTASDYRKEL